MDYNAVPPSQSGSAQPVSDGLSESSAALALVEEMMRDRQGHCVSDLQRVILSEVLQGRRYREIADRYGCTEGHAKDVGSQLWKSLSELLGEKVTKRNLRSVVERCKNKARRVKRKLQNIHRPVLPLLGSGWSEADGARHDWAGQDWTGQELGQELVGREADLAALAQLADQGRRLIVIQGAGGLGKTTLAQAFLRQVVVEQVGLLELTLAKEPGQVVAAEQWIEDWLQQQFEIAPKAEFARNLALLKHQLQIQPFGILIDNMESALDSQGQFLPGLRGYGELLRMLVQVPGVTLVTSRDRLCDPALALHHYALPGLNCDAWTTVFEQQQVQISDETLRALHHTYGGNAKAMGLVSAAIAADFGGDGAAYWQLHQQDPLGSADLSNLIEHQITRLEESDVAAYRLFCRLGCYRNQGGPALQAAELKAMLWDVPAGQQLRLTDSLRRRSLLEHNQGRYSLHPALRSAAVARLQASSDWEEGHRQAVQHWQTRVDRITCGEDALTAFEAYPHAIAIQDYQLAAEILLQSRINQWDQFLPLASTLHRLGRVQPVLEAMEQLVDKLSPSLQRAELQNILGDLYSLRGQLGQAIACQEAVLSQVATVQQDALLRGPTQPPELASRVRYYRRMLAIDARLSLGLYRLDQGENYLAEADFQQVIAQAQDTAHHAWAEKAAVCLALVYARQGQLSQARQLIASGGMTLLGTEPQSVAIEGRWAYFVQLLGQVYIQLSEMEKARCCFNQSLVAAELAHYPQIEARSRLGLAQLAIAQQQWEQAQQLIGQAIATLEDLGALCDLAEAHFQRAVLQQASLLHSDDQTIETCSEMSLKQAIAYLAQAQAPARIQQLKGHFQTSIKLAGQQV